MMCTWVLSKLAMQQVRIKYITFKIHLGIQYRTTGLWAGWSAVRVPAEAGNFTLHCHVHRASYPLGTRGTAPRGKEAGARLWPVTSISCRGKERVEVYLHSPNTPSWRGAQL